MDESPLPYFKYLRAVLNDLRDLPMSESQAKQFALARRLLDFLVTRSMQLPRAREEFLKRSSALTDNMQAALGGELDSDSVSQFSEPFAALKAAHEDNAFDDALQSLKDIQVALLNAADPGSLATAKQILDLEADYNAQLNAALRDAAHSVAPATRSNTTGAPFAPAVDTEKLAAFLRYKFPEETALAIKGFDFLAGGFSKVTLGVKLTNARVLPDEIVLRADSSAIHSAGSVTSEFSLLAALFKEGICVPRPLAVEPSGEVFGSPFILVAKKPGAPIGSLLQLPKPNAIVARDVALQLARIHTMPLDRVIDALPKVTPKPSDWVLALLDQDYENWRSLNVASPVYETAFAWLRQNKAINDAAPRGLIHGDYGLQNILVSEGKVSAVLDWEFACVGNPAYDLGYFYDQAESLSSWEDFLRFYVEGGAPRPSQEQLDYNILLTVTRFGVMSVRLHTHVAKSGEVDGASATLIGENFVGVFAERVAHALKRVLR